MLYTVVVVAVVVVAVTFVNGDGDEVRVADADAVPHAKQHSTMAFATFNGPHTGSLWTLLAQMGLLLQMYGVNEMKRVWDESKFSFLAEGIISQGVGPNKTLILKQGG